MGGKRKNKNKNKQSSNDVANVQPEEEDNTQAEPAVTEIEEQKKEEEIPSNNPFDEEFDME